MYSSATSPTIARIMNNLPLHRPEPAHLPHDLKQSAASISFRTEELTQLFTSQYSRDPYGYDSLCSLSYRSTRYCIIDPLSKRRIGFPSVKVSVMAGMRPLGLISRNHGSFVLSVNISPLTSHGLVRGYLLRVLPYVDGRHLVIVNEAREGQGWLYLRTLYSSPSSSSRMDAL